MEKEIIVFAKMSAQAAEEYRKGGYIGEFIEDVDEYLKSWSKWERAKNFPGAKELFTFHFHKNNPVGKELRNCQNPTRLLGKNT